MYNFMLSIFIIALIETIIFLFLMLRSQRQSKRRRRMMQFMIIGIIFVLGIPPISSIAGINNIPPVATVTSKEYKNSYNTDKDGIYILKLSADNKNARVRAKSNPYIIDKKNNDNKLQITVKLPNNIKSTDINYVGTGQGMTSYSSSQFVYNNSNAYNQVKEAKAKQSQEKEEQEDKQEEAEAKKEEQEKQNKEAKYKAQYPPIEDKLSNPLNATESQQGQPYLIRGKVIDMAGLPTGMQYIIQDKNGNKYFTFVNMGDLKGGHRANLDDKLDIYANSIYPDTINQNDIDNGMVASHVGEKVTNALADRVYLKRTQ